MFANDDVLGGRIAQISYRENNEQMASRVSELAPCPMFIGGEWLPCEDLDKCPVYNPSTGEVITEAPLATGTYVDQAVEAAQAAYPGWRDTPPMERARVFYRYRTLIEENFDSLAELITREHGKTLAESRGGLYRGLENIEFACGTPSLLMGDTIKNVAPGLDCETYYEPLGVCAGITPFNFPAMVPLWMYPLAIVCGNTFVFKPSEKVPLTANRIVELLHEAGLPAGVMNIVHGTRSSVEAILAHPKVKAVSFVGSTPVARYIYETATRNGKRVQANGGAKNLIVVMPDADIIKTVNGVTGGAYGCAGERCMASSTAVAVAEAADELVPVLKKAADAIEVGPTDRMPQPEMGPVITADHRDRVSGLVSGAEEDGAKVLSDGRGIRISETPNGFYLGATLVDGVGEEMAIAQEEVFGPVLTVMRVDSLDGAVELVNRSAYGNGTAIYTSSGKVAREFKHRVNAGMVGINVAVPASVALFPFTGWNSSFFGDLHIQGKEAIAFYTQQRVVTTRWFSEGEGDIWRK